MPIKDEDIDFSDFYDTHLCTLESPSLLFGNGLFLSHSNKDIVKAYKLVNEECQKVIINVTRDMETLSTSSCNVCPEDLLFNFRTLYGLHIFSIYLDKQKKFNSPRPANFLNKFKSIYTTNFDINTYKIVFPEEGIAEFNFTNGFCGETWVNSNKIEESLEKNKHLNKFYFLHGSFPLFQNNKGAYSVIIKSKEEKLSEILEKKYKKLISDFKEQCKSQKWPEIEENPVLVFSGKTIYKTAFVNDDPYLNFCSNKLSEEKAIFTFGCSFKIDKHLLDRILEGEDKKKIFFGVLDNQAREIIHKYITTKHPQQISKHEIYFIKLENRDEVRKRIWSEEINNEAEIKELFSRMPSS